MQNNTILATLALGCAALFAAPSAFAGCGTPDAIQVAQGKSSVLGLVPGARIARSLARVTRAPLTFVRPSASGKAVVGMWQFTFISQGNAGLGIPDGAVLDDGYQTWHSDGTEITNSARPPKTQSFCTGVWDYAAGEYQLNHYALSWSPDGDTFVGPANIREHVSVDAGANRFNGRFSIDQYNADGSVVLVHLDGIIQATRVTVN
jgi:hypothetical protein